MFKKCVLASIVLVALTACSSGSSQGKNVATPQAKQPDAKQPMNPEIKDNSANGTSSSESSQSSEPAPQPQPQPQPAPTPKVEKEKSFGGIYFLKNKDKADFFTPFSDISGLVIGGKPVSLTPTRGDQQGTVGEVTFGYKSQKNATGDYFFAIGELTKEMPKNGIVTYTGDALYSVGTWLEGTSSFKVNFDAKTVNGKLNIKGLDEITLLQAAIKDNQFHGKNENEWIQGNFFGEHASALGGVWKKTGKADAATGNKVDPNFVQFAVFGATKQ